MDILTKAQKALENYNAKKFHDNLVLELKNKGIKKGIFCRKIGRDPAWISRILTTKKPQAITLAAIEREFNIDILKLAGIESKHTIRIHYKRDNDEKIIIRGKIINLNEIHQKVKIILSYSHEAEILIGFVESLYKILQDKISITIPEENII